VETDVDVGDWEENPVLVVVVDGIGHGGDIVIEGTDDAGVVGAGARTGASKSGGGSGFGGGGEGEGGDEDEVCLLDLHFSFCVVSHLLMVVSVVGKAWGLTCWV
jgi:hypothetical protein